MKPGWSKMWNVCPGGYVAPGACGATAPHLSRDLFIPGRKPFPLSFVIFSWRAAGGRKLEMELCSMAAFLAELCSACLGKSCGHEE